MRKDPIGRHHRQSFWEEVMEKMTIEKAREYLNKESSKQEAWKIFKSEGFIEGYESREEEIRELKKVREKFVCPCGETTYVLEPNPNHFVGCVIHGNLPPKELK